MASASSAGVGAAGTGSRLVEIGRQPVSTGLAPDIHTVDQARRAAVAARSRWLVDVMEGRERAVDAPWTVCAAGHRPLLKLRLVQLMATAPRWDAGRTNAAVGHVAAILGLPAGDVRAADLAWLADPRSAGRRILAWLDAFRPRSLPWPGFPYAPVPDDFPSGPGQPPPLAARTRQGTPR